MEASVRAGTLEMPDRERLAARLGVPMSGIAAFCERWGVEELALFGSVLRDDFGPDSDIDAMVRLETGFPLGPIRPARRSRMKRSQSRCDSVSGLRSRPRRSRNILVATLSRYWTRSPLVGVTSSP